MPPFELHRPKTVEEACAMAANLIESGQEFDWIAGGTDLIPNYKWHINTKPHVISLAGIEGVSTISMTEIGCMARLHDIAEGGNAHPLISEAASKVASSLIRRNATLGGNLCLDTRCFWYNQAEEWRSSIDWCHKCDCGTGADCRVIPNQNELCVATYQGDVAPNLMVLNATVHLIGPNGARSVLLHDFYQLDGMTRNILEPGEFMLKITLPDDVADWTGSYRKLRVRESWDFPEAGAAAAWKKGDRSTLKSCDDCTWRVFQEDTMKKLQSANGDVKAICDAVYTNLLNQ
jgi:4-hydroxybenzoyl-CoA reductase subunit beta